MFAYQPAGERMRLQCLGMPQKKHLVLRCVRSDIAEQLEQGVASVLRQQPFRDGVEMKTTALDKADALHRTEQVAKATGATIQEVTCKLHH